MNSSRLTLRIYPASKSSVFTVFLECIRYAPVAIALLVLLHFALTRLSWWALVPVLLAMMAVHVYLTTDLMLSDERRAEAMGYGLERRGSQLLYIGLAQGERFRRNISAPIRHIEVIDGEPHVHTEDGRIIPLTFLSSPARQRFTGSYEALKEGVSLDGLTELYPDFKAGFGGLRWKDGPARTHRAFENIATLLFCGIELFVSLRIANALQMMF